MADDAYRLASLVDGLDEVRDLRVAPELIRRPTARDYDPVKLQRIHLVCRNVRSSLEEILAGDRLRTRSAEITSAPYSLRRITVTQYSRSSNPSATSTTIFLPLSFTCGTLSFTR
jgi:hypothetical protein